MEQKLTLVLWLILQKDGLQLVNPQNVRVWVVFLGKLLLLDLLLLLRLLLLSLGGLLLLGRALTSVTLIILGILLLVTVRILARLNHLLGQLSREEPVVNTLALQVVGPHFPLPVRHQIGLVDEKQVLLLGVDVFDVDFQILGTEHERVSGIDNLDNYVRTLDNSP